MIVAGQRIAIRIGDDQALCRTYKDAIGVVVDSIRRVYTEKQKQESGGQVFTKDFEELHNELGALRRTFVEQAVARVGSDLP